MSIPAAKQAPAPDSQPAQTDADGQGSVHVTRKDIEDQTFLPVSENAEGQTVLGRFIARNFAVSDVVPIPADLYDQLIEYFEDRPDTSDGSDGWPMPNEAMNLLGALKRARR